MKKLIGFFVICAIFFSLSGCKVGSVSSSGGVDNTAQLQFIRGTANAYKDGVDVFIDNNAPFKAKVDKEKTIKGNVYTIQNGKRNIRVEYRGTILYERAIVIGIGETRKIRLP